MEVGIGSVVEDFVAHFCEIDFSLVLLFRWTPENNYQINFKVRKSLLGEFPELPRVNQRQC
jgi:hypothetical protein